MIVIRMLGRTGVRMGRGMHVLLSKGWVFETSGGDEMKRGDGFLFFFCLFASFSFGSMLVRGGGSGAFGLLDTLIS